MAKDTLTQLLYQKCSKLPATDALILSAIITVESGWKVDAIRFEPNFLYICRPEEFAIKNGITSATERCLQRFSYGLGQLMGGTCRGLGFDRPLMQLLDPSLNLDYVILFFNKTCGEYVYGPDKIAAYNAGTVKRGADGKYLNQGYVDKVLFELSKDPIWRAAQNAVPSSNLHN